MYLRLFLDNSKNYKVLFIFLSIRDLVSMQEKIHFVLKYWLAKLKHTQLPNKYKNTI